MEQNRRISTNWSNWSNWSKNASRWAWVVRKSEINIFRNICLFDNFWAFWNTCSPSGNMPENTKNMGSASTNTSKLCIKRAFGCSFDLQTHYRYYMDVLTKFWRFFWLPEIWGSNFESLHYNALPYCTLKKARFFSRRTRWKFKYGVYHLETSRKV